MVVQLHGVESRMFQSDKEEGGGGVVVELCSHEKRSEASWFAAETEKAGV